MKTKVELLTDYFHHEDEDDSEIVHIFYVEKIKQRFGVKKIAWGVYAENYDSDSPALIAIVSGPGCATKAKQIATVLEQTLLAQAARN